MWRSGRTLASVFVAALSGWSCGSTAPDSAPKVASIVVSPANSTLALDAQLPLQAQVHDGSGALVSDADVVWTVEDPTIVSVSTAGVVTALGIGTSQVAANALGKSGLATITVTPPPVAPTPTSPPAQAAGAVATVRVTAPSKKVKPGSTMQLTATALDEKGNRVANQSFTWSSSNTNTATVSSTGLVTGKRKGNATITARTSSGGGKSGSLKVEVK